MNKGYVYKDGQALIIDDNNNQRTVDYYDNLDEVLIQENLIEAIEKKIKSLEKEVSKFKEQSKFSKIYDILFPFMAFTFLPPIITSIIGKYFGLDTIVNGTFGQMNGITYFSIIELILFPIPGTMFSIMSYNSEKNKEKTQNGKRVQLESLKKELQEEKEYLDELKKDKTNSEDKDAFHIKKVNSSDALNTLDSFLSFYFDLGYNEDKYFKYYQDGNLDKHLEKKTNDVGIEYANEYFKEKAPSLIKSKKKNHTK